MRIILHGTENVAGMAHAAECVLTRAAEPGESIGVRIGAEFYGVRWGKNSISVWWNGAPDKGEAA